MWNSSSPGRVALENGEVVRVEQGELVVEATAAAGTTERFVLGRWDAAYLPLGSRYRLVGSGDGPADALVGVAPAYDPVG